ncbi:MAG: ANTAR domain-containing protein [Mycobacterium kyogaense]|uniref:ANTAR domain-containing protein n=1 Tax=Mycobacterium kyogaense TaxID=2212479 RepID=UPI002FFB3A30
MNVRSDDTSRQVIDIAVGILIGVRGYSRREAFDELVRVVRETGTGLGSAAAGLVAVATGSSTAEQFAAWGDVVGGRVRTPLSSIA